MNPFRNKLLLKWREPNFVMKHVKKHLSWSDWLRYFLRVVVKFVLFMLAFSVVTRLIRGDINSIYDLFSFEVIVIGSGILVIAYFLTRVASY